MLRKTSHDGLPMTFINNVKIHILNMYIVIGILYFL